MTWDAFPRKPWCKMPSERCLDLRHTDQDSVRADYFQIGCRKLMVIHED
jgi:hypothetical protein